MDDHTIPFEGNVIIKTRGKVTSMPSDFFVRDLLDMGYNASGGLRKTTRKSLEKT